MRKKNIACLVILTVFVLIYCYRLFISNADLAQKPSLVFHEVCMRIPNGTDPIRAGDPDSPRLIRQIYEGLYTFHPYKVPLSLEPNLAEALPDVSSDGLTYTIRIKKGIYFQDNQCFTHGKGRELTSTDVIFTLKRLVDPNNTVPYRKFIDGKIVGLDAWKQRVLIDYSQEVEGLKALDPHTVQIKLVKPWPNFIHFLAMWPTFIVPHEAVEYYGAMFVNHPVGTGPFMLEGEFNMQASRIEFVRNPNFREKFFPEEAHSTYQHVLAYAGKRLPFVDKIVMHIIAEEQPSWLKLQNAEIDVHRILDGAFTAKIVSRGKLVPELADKGLEFASFPGRNTEFFAYNHQHELFNNVYLRQAMSMAFNRERYNAIFYNHAAEVAYSFVPPTLLEDIGNSPTHVYAYHPELAKEYLIKAGYPGGKGLPVITLDTQAATIFKNKADFFAKCMADVGIHIQVRTHSWTELYNMVCKHKTMMHFFTWEADYPDPSTFLQVISDKHLCGLQYVDPVFNKLYSQAITVSDKQERYKMYATLNQMVAEQIPMIFAVHAPVQFVYYKWVKNFFYHEFDRPLTHYIAIDINEKKRMCPQQALK